MTAEHRPVHRAPSDPRQALWMLALTVGRHGTDEREWYQTCDGEPVDIDGLVMSVQAGLERQAAEIQRLRGIISRAIDESDADNLKSAGDAVQDMLAVLSEVTPCDT